MDNAVNIYLFVDVHETFHYFTKQLPNTTSIVTEASADVVSQCALLAELHLQNTACIINLKSNLIFNPFTLEPILFVQPHMQYKVNK